MKLTPEDERKLRRKEAQLRAIADQFLAAMRQHEQEGCGVHPCVSCRKTAFRALEKMVIEATVKEAGK